MFSKGNSETTLRTVRNCRLVEASDSILESYSGGTPLLAALSNSITVVSKLK